MYTEFDYLNTNDLYKIQNLLNDVIVLFYKIYPYNFYIGQEWRDKELLQVEKINNLENAIEYIGVFIGYPTNWITSKEWSLTEEQNINYQDLNRMINNLNALKDKLNTFEYRYINEIYCGEEISL